MSRKGALTDRPFMTFAALDGVMGLQYQVISIMLPIWIATRAHAPHWTVAAAFAANSLVCVFFQTRFGAAVASAHDGGRAFRRAGLLFLLSCPLIAASADVPGVVAPLVIVAAVCVHSAGEIWQSRRTSHSASAWHPIMLKVSTKGYSGSGSTPDRR